MLWIGPTGLGTGRYLNKKTPKKAYFGVISYSLHGIGFLTINMKMRTTTVPQSCSSIEGNRSSVHMSRVIHSVICEKENNLIAAFSSSRLEEKNLSRKKNSPPPGLLIDCWELDEGWPGTRYTEPWRSQYNNG